MAGSSLDLVNVHAGYRGLSVLHNISLTIPEGSFTTIIGPNGHGKTTLLRCISGLIDLSAGDVIFDGVPLKNLRADQIVELGIVHVPQGDILYPDMTVRDNLLMGAYLPSASADADNRLTEVHRIFPLLAERRSQIASTLSGGERRMLSIGRGLMTGGRLLMIDEPSLGLAPVVVDQIYEVVADFKKQRRTIVLVEENASRVMDLADAIILIDNGQIVWQGAPDELMTHAEIVETYLGG
jgi:branched-chain amino acid transport system ATP-binding protein